MKQLEAMKAVYCYFFPEVRPLMKQVEEAIPSEMFKVTTRASDIAGVVGSLFTPELVIPSTPAGCVALDDIHEPVIERVVRAYEDVVPALHEFPYQYPTPGSSEGLHKLLTHLRIHHDVREITVLSGEYEGYGVYAADLGMRVNVVNPSRVDPQRGDPRYWFISNPSARDGNILPNEFIRELCDHGHKVVLDLAYAGMTRPYAFDVSHENIIAVVLSLSKQYGLFRFRIGFTFSREDVRSLYGNKWFKDPVRLLQGLKVVEEFRPGVLYERYREKQELIITRMNDEYCLGVKQSDVFLLGYLPSMAVSGLRDEQRSLIAPYQRGDGYRFCLTPYFEIMEEESYPQRFK